MKKNKLPSLVIISILTLTTIVVWIVFSIIRIFVSAPAIDVPPQVLEPLNPTLDETVLNSAQDAIFFETGAQILPLPVSSPIPTATPLPTPSPTATQEATSSGTTAPGIP